MKFLEFLISNQIQIWKDFYINYNLLKQIIKPLHALYKTKLRSLYLKKSNIDESREALLLTLNEPDVNIPKIAQEFQTQIILELQKVHFFYTETLHKKIEPRLFEIQEQIDFAKAKKELDLSHRINLDEFNDEILEYEIATKRFIDTYTDDCTKYEFQTAENEDCCEWRHYTHSIEEFEV